MDETSTHPISRAVRIALACVAGVIVIWSLYWVLTRPLRQKKELGGRTEIILIHWGAREEDEIVESLRKSFEEEHPDIKIKRINAAAGYGTMVQTMVAAGNPPDVIFMNSQMLASYVGNDVLLPLDSFVEEDIKNGRLGIDFDDFYPQTLDSFRFDGTVTGRGELYGIPSSWEPLGFY